MHKCVDAEVNEVDAALIKAVQVFPANTNIKACLLSAAFILQHDVQSNNGSL